METFTQPHATNSESTGSWTGPAFGNRVFAETTQSQRRGFGWEVIQYADVFRKLGNLDADMHIRRSGNKIDQLFL